MTLKIAALASGRGSNVASILKQCQLGNLDAEIVLVLSNNPDALVVQTMQQKNIPVWVKDHKAYPDRKIFDAEMLKVIQASGADTIALCGYMRLLSKDFIQAYQNRILNIHPAILPSFPGAHGSKDAWEYGVRFTGCTVHFVVEEMDAGPVIIQGITPISTTETEAEFMPRVHAMEHRIYPQALHWLAQGRLIISGRRVLLQGEQPQAGVSDLGLGCSISPALESF